MRILKEKEDTTGQGTIAVMCISLLSFAFHSSHHSLLTISPHGCLCVCLLVIQVADLWQQAALECVACESEVLRAPDAIRDAQRHSMFSLAIDPFLLVTIAAVLCRPVSASSPAGGSSKCR